MNHPTNSPLPRRTARRLAMGAVAAGAFCLLQCQSTAIDAVSKARSVTAWATVYEVLQHPRCLNCHPVDDVPLVGEHSEPHPQNVQRGPNGVGVFAMTCTTCHRGQNTAGEHMPPGVVGWHMPPRHQPMVFEGRKSAELARQLADPKQNGNRSPADLLHHVTQDSLVLWGWQPGDGRAPVSVPHAQFVAAFQQWVDGGCQVPQ
ncbi:MAG: hypothetical protein ABIP94_04405 [Planctomycetota bacterium]